MLRVAILSTDTPHHRYFLDRIAVDCAEDIVISAIVFETKGYPWRRLARRHFRRCLPNLIDGALYNPYLGNKRHAERQARFELQAFFPQGMPEHGVWDHAIAVHDANDASVVELLARLRPDVIFVYGTGKLRPAVFEKSRLITINAHGGRLPRYRGLDTNLWAAFEGRTEDICVTLHEMNEDLDAGRVLMERAIPPDPQMSVVSLRYFTTLVCCELFRDLIVSLRSGALRFMANRGGPSRYYGPMPWLYRRQTDILLREWASMAASIGVAA